MAQLARALRAEVELTMEFVLCYSMIESNM